MSYASYLTDVLRELSKKVRDDCHCNIPPGAWHGVTKPEYCHILPLEGKNNRRNRAKAISKYLGIEIDDKFLPSGSKGKGETLHPYAHHLNSSQLLCYTAFRNLLTDRHTPTPNLISLFRSLGIEVSDQAICDFEFSDGWLWEQENEKEGTSFDFHIKDGEREFFFEIKFTEAGFGKAVLDDRHKRKINDIYIKRIAKILDNTETIDVEDCAANYQLFRNLIRGDSAMKTVIFITDENNEKTKTEIDNFKDKFLMSSSVKPLFLTWQQINANWPKDIVKPFQFVCFENPSSF